MPRKMKEPSDQVMDQPIDTVAGSIPDTHEIQVAYEGRKFVAHSTAPDFDTAVAKAEALARGNGGKPVRVVKDGQELRVFSRAEG